MLELLASSLPLLLVLVQSPAGEASGAPDDPEPPPETPSEAARLFAESCASCHGADGDGKGTARLDRQARSFRDGGFSFGNTPEALLRTITIGIPGTPMPGFDTSLDEAQRRALAEYVLTLGPETTRVEPEDTVLVVGEQPLVVRGHLPPIVLGGEEGEAPPGVEARPRGLLVGLTDGLTLEYRTDDVRLLGVRQGGFVERTDWIGRGGTPLAPLGRVVHLVEGGAPQPTLRLARADGAPPLAAALAGTWVRGKEAGLAYRLVAGGRTLARVEESGRGVGTSVGGGFERRFRLHAEVEPLDLYLRLAGLAAGDAVVETFRTMGPSPASEVHWTLLRRAGGGLEALGVGLPLGVEPLRGDTALEAPLRIVPGVAAEVVVTVVLPTEWTEDAGLRLASEVGR